MIDKTYSVGYKLMKFDPPKTRDKIYEEEGLGGCDAVVVFSLILPEDGSRSEMIASLDGRTGEPLDDGELFKCLIGLAHRLSESETLGRGRRGFATAIFKEARRAILAARKEAGY